MKIVSRHRNMCFICEYLVSSYFHQTFNHISPACTLFKIMVFLLYGSFSVWSIRVQHYLTQPIYRFSSFLSSFHLRSVKLLITYLTILVLVYLIGSNLIKFFHLNISELLYLFDFHWNDDICKSNAACSIYYS